MENGDEFDIDKVDLKKQGPKSLKNIIEHYDNQYEKDMTEAIKLINNMFLSYCENS